MQPPAVLKEGKFDVPPDGVDDWLWFLPVNPDNLQRNYSLRRMTCDKCKVMWDQEIELSLPVRCWCCGRFKRKPKICY